MVGKGQSEEKINHPSHYTSHPSGVECIDVVEHMTFNVGNAIKYLWRHGLKEVTVTDAGRRETTDASIVDLRKAEWYVRREIERLIAQKGKA